MSSNENLSSAPENSQKLNAPLLTVNMSPRENNIKYEQMRFYESDTPSNMELIIHDKNSNDVETIAIPKGNEIFLIKQDLETNHIDTDNSTLNENDVTNPVDEIKLQLNHDHQNELPVDNYGGVIYEPISNIPSVV